MKLTKEEHGKLQNTVEALKALQSQIGSIEYQKYLTLNALEKANEDLAQQRTALNEKYGDVNIDIETGELSEQQK